MEYKFTKRIDASFTDTVRRVKESLAKEGFGVLTEIDVKATMKQKLDAEYDDYVILGACNPPLAHKALQAQKDIGLLLPRNIIVYAEDGATTVAAIRPSAALGVIDNPALLETAKEAEKKLQRVIDTL